VINFLDLKDGDSMEKTCGTSAVIVAVLLAQMFFSSSYVRKEVTIQTTT
jgi:hypothetical protein